MRILALTRYTSLGPSSRIRFYQYFPYLQSQGIDVHVSPFLGDAYIRHLFYGKQPPFFTVALAYINRILLFMNSHSFDLLWVEKELFPWLPTFMDDLWLRKIIPLVIDYDDAVFHRYDLNANRMIRSIFGNKIDSIMRKATTVVVGNDYLAEHALQAGVDKVEYLPSAVDVKRYSLREGTGAQFRIGWIGTPTTAPNLEIIKDALSEVISRTGAHLVIVGSGEIDPLPGLEKTILPWSEDTEADIIQSCDVGIMPLMDGPFERGKCSYKLIQYMACGLPVVASPVGNNSAIIDQGKNGFLASNKKDWIEALVMLSKDVKLRNEMGVAGRRKIEQEYDLHKTAPQLLKILNEAARG